VQADWQCSKFKNVPWLPELHHMYIEHRYWAIQASSLSMGHNYNHLLVQLWLKLGITNSDPNQHHTIWSYLCQIQTKFREIWQKAAEHCKSFLNDLMITAKATKNKQRQQLIWHLKTAEDNQRCFALTKQIIKLQSAGGLTHILDTPDNGQMWESITNQCSMEAKLLQHSQTHFSQAHGMAYTQPPLQDLLQYDGLTEFGNQLFQGKIPQDLDVSPMTRLLLKHQKSLLLPNEDISNPLTFEGLMAGFKKWPEKTSTSPSGCHFGIYKSMLKDLPEKDNNKQNPQNIVVFTSCKPSTLSFN